MPPTDTLPLVIDNQQTRWRNWHQTVDTPVGQWLTVWNADPNRSSLAGYQGTTQGLQDLIRRAMAEDRSIRAHGGTWSFGPVAATDGILLNTQPLNYRFPIAAGDVHPAHAGGPLIFAQCGMSVADLNHYLDAKQLALPTCGASNGQTIAGAVSTGTHGAAFKIGAMQDFVRAIHLVPSPDESIWLEPASRRATNDDLAARVGARLETSDALFKAALVSFGSFGLIHGLLLEVAPTFFLQIWRKEMPLDAAMWSAIGSLDFSGVDLPGADGREPDHFQVVINPYDEQRRGIVTVMYRSPTRPPGSAAPSIGGRWSQGDSALEAIGLVTDLFPDLTGPLSKALEKIAQPKVENVCGRPGQVFRDTTTRGKAAGAGLGVRLDQVEQAIGIARARAVAIGAPALLAIRLVKQTDATLGFTRFGPATAVIDLDGAQSNRQKRFFSETFDALENEGVEYTFHWGKLNEVSPARMQRMYGAGRVQAWLDARRDVLPTPALRRAFANDFTDQAGLSA